METTRQQILSHLFDKPGATSNEISRLLNSTPANIRHHLKRLAQDGLIHTIGSRPAHGRGRPSKVYALTSKGNGLPNLLSKVFPLFLADNPSDNLHQLAAQLADTNDQTQAPIAQRLFLAMKRLNKLHYQAHWEAHADGPLITLGHCPYLQVIDHNPQLCQMDEALINILINLPASLIEKQSPNALGLPVCVFRIG